MIETFNCVDVFLRVVWNPAENINISLLESASWVVMSTFVHRSDFVPQVKTDVVHFDALGTVLSVLARSQTVNKLWLYSCQWMSMPGKFQSAAFVNSEVLSFDFPWLIHWIRNWICIKGSPSDQEQLIVRQLNWLIIMRISESDIEPSFCWFLTDYVIDDYILRVTLKAVDTRELGNVWLRTH